MPQFRCFFEAQLSGSGLSDVLSNSLWQAEQAGFKLVKLPLDLE